MKAKELVERWERMFPLSLQEDWDNSGAQLGRFDREVHRVIVALDFDDDLVDYAVLTGAEMIFTHHPALFRPIRRLTDEGPAGRRVLKAIENGISVYSSHTPLDFGDGGINDYLAERLGLTDTRCLAEHDDPEKRDLSRGMGVAGMVEEMTAEELAELAKRVLGAPHVILYGDPKRLIHKVGLMGGAGADFIDAAVKLGCDCYLTGDIKHHEALDGIDAGICLIDLGHYRSESLILERVRDIFQGFDPELSVDIFRASENRCARSL